MRGDGELGPAWDVGRYDFVRHGSASPDTVHPSLWRQAQLNAIAGLFEVVPGVYQVRGLDLSNMTLVEGDDGVLVIDPLISVETGTGRLSRRWWISIMECSSVLRRSIWQRSFTAHNRSPSVSAPRYAPSREMMGMAE